MRRPEPSDHYAGPPPEPYRKKGSIWPKEQTVKVDDHPLNESELRVIERRTEKPTFA